MQLLLLIPAGLLLGVQSIYDIRSQKIPTWTIWLGTALGLVAWLGPLESGVEQLFGLLVGVLALLFARISKQTLGYGDGLVLCNLGITLGFGPCLRVLFLALFFGGVWALILIVVRKANRKTRLPFIPFLFFGYFVEVMLRLC